MQPYADGCNTCGQCWTKAPIEAAAMEGSQGRRPAPWCNIAEIRIERIVNLIEVSRTSRG